MFIGFCSLLESINMQYFFSFSADLLMFLEENIYFPYRFRVVLNHIFYNHIVSGIKKEVDSWDGTIRPLRNGTALITKAMATKEFDFHTRFSCAHIDNEIDAYFNANTIFLSVAVLKEVALGA